MEKIILYAKFFIVWLPTWGVGGVSAAIHTLFRPAVVKRGERESEAADLPVDLHSYSHLWVVTKTLRLLTEAAQSRAVTPPHRKESAEAVQASD